MINFARQAGSRSIFVSRRLMSQQIEKGGKEMTVPHMVGAVSVIGVALLGLPMFLMYTRERPATQR